MRYWSLLFFLTAAACTATFAFAPFHAEWWLPSNVSAIGRDVDRLFWIVLWITGGVFLITQGGLAFAMWKFAARPGSKAIYSHGSQRAELIWTVIPAILLIFLAFYQMGTWAGIKFKSSKPKVGSIARVTGRQFQWLMQYPGPDGRIGTEDDLHLINDLRFVKDRPVVIDLRSKDVLHSFFLPQFRIKQDAVPGRSIPVWFDSDRAGNFELACAELCGWGHYKMRGMVTVYETQAEWDDWMKTALREQSLDQAPGAPRVAESGRTAPR